MVNFFSLKGGAVNDSAEQLNNLYMTLETNNKQRHRHRNVVLISALFQQSCILPGGQKISWCKHKAPS